jgi:hypothetical protein
MTTGVMFLDCPAYMDDGGTTRCGLPAAVECKYVIGSTEGPLESAMIRCPRGHWFNGPMEALIWEEHANAATPRGTTHPLSTPRMGHRKRI